MCSIVCFRYNVIGGLNPNDQEVSFNKIANFDSRNEYISTVINSNTTSANGSYTKKCESFFENKYNFNKTILTTSCTSALEMCALILDLKPKDEIIMPSFTYVSTANAFAKQGAKIIFADSKTNSPNIDEEKLEKLITKDTKAIVIVHYAGIAANMEKILKIAEKHNIYIIEDAAQAIDSYYKDKALGSFGHLSALSFHETKNIQCGEGGLLIINDKNLIQKAEIISNNGTNKGAFTRGEVDKYEWIGIGSSYKPSDIIAAYLLSQLENIELIQQKRIKLWNKYFKNLQDLKAKEIQIITPDSFSTINAHMFYLICRNEAERNMLITHLKTKNITATFHYQCLHKSPYYLINNTYNKLNNAEKFEKTIIRLPLFYNLTIEEVNYISNEVIEFFK